MRADIDVLHDEARDIIKRALRSYPGDPSHVSIYVASRTQSWNAMQAQLSRLGYKGSGRIRIILDVVEDHIESQLRQYLK